MTQNQNSVIAKVLSFNIENQIKLSSVSSEMHASNSDYHKVYNFQSTHQLPFLKLSFCHVWMSAASQKEFLLFMDLFSQLKNTKTMQISYETGQDFASTMRRHWPLSH